MEYNEQAFKEKANLKAMKVWLALIAIMTLSYGSDLSKGIYTATQYVVFLVMAWVPFAIGLLTLKLKGRATPYYKDVLALGYGFFYAYVVCITDSATAYAYILPLTSMLIPVSYTHLVGSVYDPPGRILRQIYRARTGCVPLPVFCGGMHGISGTSRYGGKASA